MGLGLGLRSGLRLGLGLGLGLWLGMGLGLGLGPHVRTSDARRDGAREVPRVRHVTQQASSRARVGGIIPCAVTEVRQRQERGHLVG